MNIKFVYNQKTHKISSKKNQTLAEVRGAILNVYPNELQNGFTIYATLDQTQPPYQLQDEQFFSRVKDLYTHLGWQSIKFIVKDINNPQLTADDINALNQSVVIKQNVQLSQFDDILQKKVADQPKEEKQEIKQINTQEQQNNVAEGFTQQIIQQINKLSLQDVDCNNEEFKKFIIEQVDERLVFHGIIVNNKKPQVQKENPINPQYKMQVIYKQNNEIQMEIGKPYKWEVHLKNDGNVIWKKGAVKLVGIAGTYKDLKIELQNDVKPQEEGLFSYVLNPPVYEVNNVSNEFKLAHFNGNRPEFFGQKVCFCLFVKNNIEKNERPSTITQKDAKFNATINDSKLQKINKLTEILGIHNSQAQQFVEENQNLMIEELVQAFLDKKN
ncbi:unnamed protein product (macronuclear) [Paramecium tetraurelia]|uniref:Next to BRCA1 central domain-containing protein n=1 Tax=Paramecium tetraurelia TaxID=5888 RepID=A0EGW2_PARTE|nr:uncharacterized protein GSPATT00026877001 [Paramecium tetraurelia]CAK94553.1 unnamed protein product [Paramecium tetraurelia]|eukprot:XP_001461926.1 hypothetical protein (macronuclear) [Paramecium tetraurelia strain d4-2]